MLSGSVLVLLFPIYKLVQACSDGPDPYDYYPQFFSPATLGAPAYAPFHYTAQLEYYDEWYDYTADEAIPDANIAAWNAFTGNTVSPADLDSFIYRYPYASLNHLYAQIEKGAVAEPEVVPNGLTKWFQRSKDLEALGYLMYAKQCEPFVTSGGDWEAAPAGDTAKVSRLIKNGQQLHAAAKQDFFKERYAYQVIRLAQYGGRYRQTLQLYTKLIGDDKTSGSEIFARCLGLKAGALFGLKRKTEAAYIYTRVFDLSDNLKRSSYLSFDWATTANVGPVLALCKSPHEKAIVYVMDGLHHFDQAMPQIQAAYAADPMVKGLDVLFTREINKLEERYLQQALLRQRALSPSGGYVQYDGEYGLKPGPDSAGNRWYAYATTLNAFAKTAGQTGPAERKAFWRLASAYLYLIQNDLPQAKQHLTAAASTEMSAREKDLHRVISVLYAIRDNKGMTATAETEILPSMKWLDERAAGNKGIAKTYQDLMSTVVATGYLQAHDTVRAIYTLARIYRGEGGKFYVSEGFLDLPGTLLERLSVDKLPDVAAFMTRPGKSAWDEWLTTGTPYTLSTLKELEGTKYLRAHQWSQASTVLGTIPATAQAQPTLPDPFIAYISDRSELTAADTAHLYTKAAFARKMDSLSRITSAEGLFAYATGLYSMTYYGKAAYAYTYYRSSVDELAYYSTPQRRALPIPVQEYYGASAAEQYFIRAAQQAGNPELKAKALWMAAKCWQKRSPLPRAKPGWEMYDDKSYYLNSLKNPYFLQLAGPLSSTTFMNEAHSTCGYLQDYAAKTKRK